MGWRADAIGVLGSSATITQMVDRAIDRHRSPPPRAGQRRRAIARRVVETVETERATWQVWHVRAEALRQLRSIGAVPGDVEKTVDRIVADAVNRLCVAFDEPDPMTDLRLRAGSGPPQLAITELRFRAPAGSLQNAPDDTTLGG